MSKLKINPAIGRTLRLMLLAMAVMQTVQGQTDGEENTVNLGYFSQPKQAVTGAITTVTGQELEKSPVANISETFAGRFSGLITMESDGQLSNSVLKNYVRGISTINGQEPLYILDGVICSFESIEYITPQEIESISVLKDASLTSIFGIEGAGGAILINTKRGRVEGLKVSATFDQSFQQMTRRPRMINSWEYAGLRNEAWRNDGGAGTAPFTQAQIDGYAAGTDRELYPNTDFYGEMFKPWALMQRAGISTTAGNEKIRMFSNINFMHQGGQFVNDQSTFKPGDKHYDPQAGDNYWINFRTNLDFKINRYLDGFIRLNGNVTKEKVAGNTMGSAVENSNKLIYGGLFYLPSTLYGPYTPISVDPENPSKVYGGEVITNEHVDNPSYGMLNRFGFGKYTGTNVMAQTGLNLDMSFLTQGLTFGGRFAYETNSSGYHHVGAQFERWVRDNNSAVLGFDRIGQGTWDNKPLDYQARPGGTGYKLSLFSYRMNANVQIDYKRDFGKHSVAAMAYGYYQNYISERTDGIYGFPYNRLSAGVTASWSYDDRYFVKVDAAYSGSDQFSRSQRFIATPSVAAAWVLSREKFLSDVKWLSLLKIRASAGITGNDQMGGGRFLYTDNYINGGALYVNSLGYTITEYMNGNLDLMAEKVMKQNYGIDLTLFKNLSLSVDYFRSYTDNMLVNPIGRIPSFSGITEGITAPVNEGEMKNHGLEVSLSYFKSLDKNWSLFASGNVLWTENKLVKIPEAPAGTGYAYQYRSQGYAYGQPFGYKIDRSKNDGYFTSQEELDQVYYTFGTPRIGDFRYQNLNGDKTADGRDIIDEKDLAPVGNPILPKVYYGITLGARYKAFELSCLVQGAGGSSRQYHNVLGMDESLMGGIYSDIHLNAWTPERYASGSEITFPALSQQNSVSRQPNDFFTMNTSYVRLKNVELSYSLPKTVLKLINASEIRIVLNAQNLFTWDCMKTDAIDPEIASLDTFQNYRVFNVGIKLTF